jgi:transcriptional regulator NrdR family protein
MKCLLCLEETTRVQITIPYVDNDVPKVLRKRICQRCEHKFTTLEQSAEPSSTSEPGDDDTTRLQ